MQAFLANHPILTNHPVLKWIVVSFLGLVVLLMLVLLFLDWNLLRKPIAHIISEKIGHPASIDHVSAHVWSWDPSITLDGLRIQNPSWAERPQMFSVKELTVQISLGELLHGALVLPRVELTAPVVSLEREKSGRASWAAENSAPAPASASPHLPAVRRLIIQDGRIHVVDRVRKLSFDGTLVADERANGGSDSAFDLHCSGSLNARPFNLHAHGGPLINVNPDRPYRFAVDVSAGDISLAVQASIPKPFDLAAYDATFKVSGADLADAYYLTNLALPNTAKFSLGGTLKHAGNVFRVDDFHGSVGASDLAGNVSVTLGGKRPKLAADLTSKRLDIADLAPTLGNNAPVQQGRGTAAPSASGTSAAYTSQSGWLLPDADLQVNRVRAMDADVNFRAESVASGKFPLQHVRFHLLLNDGVLSMDPLSFALTQGQFAGTVRIDASTAVPESDIDMRLANVDLSQFASAGNNPPLRGTLAGRVRLHGKGESLHKFASNVNGSVSLVIPHGEIRSAFAELTGINIAEGLGLLIAKEQQQTELRCGVASFEADNGRLNAKSIVMDTSNVLILGHGDIDLRNESIHLAVQGDPKKIRILRLRSPIEVGGTLLKPSIGLDPVKTLLQVGAGTLLGTLLTPVAAILAFIDPGLAKNADCSTLLAQASPTAQTSPAH
jgi:uncharacterized protein involved in outer membrane biogenesis